MATLEKARGFLSWANFRDLAVIGLVLSVSYRLAVSEIDFSGFKFTDLLSLILAISAIALSAAFYFKADESARVFQNNTYHFTKDMSEILGRIEAGFGERLRHIDESHVNLSNKLDNMPFDRNAAQRGQKLEEDLIKEREKEYKNIIDDLMQKAHLAEEERAALTGKLSELGAELERSRSELKKHKDSLSAAARGGGDRGGHMFRSMDDDLFGWFIRMVSDWFPASLKDASASRIAGRFEALLRDGKFDPAIVDKLESSGIVLEGELTRSGVSAIRAVIRSRP